MKRWITFGMSQYRTPGFSDTSRQMTQAFTGPKAYVEPPKPFSSWRTLDGTIISWTIQQEGQTDILVPPLPIPSKLDLFRTGLKWQTSKLDQSPRDGWGSAWRDETIVYVTNWTPQFQPLIQRLGPKHLVFDVVDDVLSFPYGFQRDRVLSSWRKLAAQATVVTTVSTNLQRKSTEQLQVAAVHVLPNGVDADRFMKPTGRRPVQFDESDSTVRVGFAGTLNHWIDFQSIRTLARSFPHVSFYFMGRIGHFGSQETEQDYKDAFSEQNVHYMGTVDYEELPDVLHQMDILILPRKTNNASAASNPLKLYEYLAVGKPIVTSGVPIPDEMDSCVYAATDGTGIVHAFEKALSECECPSEALTKARQNIALRNTWKHRVDEMVRLCMNH
jgi:glycosyltransferase involved in cell wall biosynthesis